MLTGYIPKLNWLMLDLMLSYIALQTATSYIAKWSCTLNILFLTIILLNTCKNQLIVGLNFSKTAWAYQYKLYKFDCNIKEIWALLVFQLVLKNQFYMMSCIANLNLSNLSIIIHDSFKF